jgi:uncharacterized protein YktA (UPF0223 family)
MLSTATEYYTEREWLALDERLTKLLKSYSKENSQLAFRNAQTTSGLTRAESNGATIDEEALIEMLGIGREIDQTVAKKKILKKEIKQQLKIFEKLSGTPAYRALKKAREDTQLMEEQFRKDTEAMEDKERQCKRDIQRLENEISLLQGAIETCGARIELGVIYTADIPDEDDSGKNSAISDVEFAGYEQSLRPF